MEVNCYEWNCDDVVKWMEKFGFENMKEKIGKFGSLIFRKGKDQRHRVNYAGTE